MLSCVFGSAGCRCSTIHRLQIRPLVYRRTHYSPLCFSISSQDTLSLSGRVAWNNPSMVGGTPVVFIVVQFEASALPGAGVIPAGLLENAFKTVSKIDPDSHMNRLRTDCLGCWAGRRRLLDSVHFPAVTREQHTTRNHNHPSRLQRSTKQTLRHHEVSSGVDLCPACSA